jgi:Zn-dependent peptidase ImmA (M78 family)
VTKRPPAKWLVEELLEVSGQDSAPVDVEVIARQLGFELRERQQPEDAVLIRDTGEIFLKADAPRSRRRFSIAHEIAHYILGHEVAYARARGQGDRPAERREADNFAAQLLMPDEWVAKAHAELGGDFDEMKSRFEVSPQSMRIRLEELRLV